MEEIKYPAIEIIRSIYRFIGWFIVFITLIVIVTGFIAVIVNQQFIGGGLFGFLGSLLGWLWGSFVVLFIYGGIGALAALVPFAIAEAFGLFIDIERNTRM
ncbi:MAG: hypothetical protein GQ524_07525 [Anaerolineales bacterium]|nr:hypothetical protein [Anaerolineales bacterium]